MAPSASLRVARSLFGQPLSHPRSSIARLSLCPHYLCKRPNRGGARFSTTFRTHHRDEASQHARFSTAAAAAAAAACLLTGIACERTISSAESQQESALVAADTGMSHPCWYEPGTVEELQHYLAECFGRRTRIVSFRPTDERSAQQIVADKFNEFMGRASENVSYGIADDKRRVEPMRTVNDDFPSLAVHLVNNGGEHDDVFQLNSDSGIPIDNELFVGRAVLVVRPDDGAEMSNDAEERSADRERFEFQLQGRFKKIPKGEIYCGAELADNNFRLGTMTRGLSFLLLRLLSQYIGPGMSYSFGGSEHDSDNAVLPHIAFPMKQAMQQVVVTPPGSDPPRLGRPFIESDESRSQRKADAGTNDWDLESTYSMSFASSCVDLPTWRILYPRSIALSTFWGNSPLRLVVYEKDGGDKIGNKYLFSLQVEFLGFPADQRATTLKEGNEIKQEVILGDKNLIR